MTTIAYTKGVMAGDTCMTSAGQRYGRMQKVSRLKSGALYGHAGDADHRALVKFLHGVKETSLPSRDDLAKLHIDTNGLLVFPNGHIFSLLAAFDKDEDAWVAEVIRISRTYAAVGSGGDYALIAMRCGKDAREAVKIACEYDIHSHPPIQTKKLKDDT